jgi:HK97 family phage major capsid protein
MTIPIDDDRRTALGYAMSVPDSRGPGEADVLDEVRASVRDFTQEQRTARLTELGGYPRLSGRQRVEHALLTQQVATEQRVMAAYQTGNIDTIADVPRDMTTGQPLPNLPPAGHGGFVTEPSGDPRVQGYRKSAMLALSRHGKANVLNSASLDRVDAVLRRGDGQGLTARYVAAVADDAYSTAFGKMVADPVQGHLRFSPAEVEAVRQVGYAQEANRIVNASLTTGATGFPLPLTIDPSIVITGAGALNPVREISNVVTVGTHDWLGVTADSVTAGYVQEGVEATDATPTLVGPKISTQQGRAFVTFSIEASQDWDTLSSQLQQLVADGRNTVDATMFLTGSGTNQPSGILNIGALNGLTTSQRVLTLTTATLAAGDSWLLKAGVPARFIASATSAANPTTWDTIFQLVPQGSTTLAQQFADSDRGGNWLGRPKVEWSTMGTGSTTGTKLVIMGDFKTGYKIVDRIGMQAELIPHMLGTNRLPLGVRGLYCYWRTGAGVIAPNALRYLEVK